MKHLVVFLLVMTLKAQLSAQDLFMKSVSEVKGMPFAGAMGKTTTLTYMRKGQMKVQLTMMGVTQTIVTDENRVIVFDPSLCGEFTKGELASDGLDSHIEYKDVVVSITGESRSLLGYSCKKALVTYKIGGIGDYAYESVFWFTNDIPVPDNSDLPSAYKTNALVEELKKLGGVVLLTETTMKMNGIKTIVTVTEVKTKKIDDEEFAVKTNQCKKPKNLVEYKKELKRREADIPTAGPFSPGYHGTFGH